jgi:hypothetical protein
MGLIALCTDIDPSPYQEAGPAAPDTGTYLVSPRRRAERACGSTALTIDIDPNSRLLWVLVIGLFDDLLHHLGVAGGETAVNG